MRLKLIVVVICIANLLTNCKDNNRKLEKVISPVDDEYIYVYDFSALLNEDEKARIDRLIKDINRNGKVEFIFCSINNEKREAVDTIAEEYFGSLNTGRNDYSNRLLIIISTITRDFKILLGEELNHLISQEELFQIRNEMIVFFRDSRFFEGLDFALKELNEKLSKKALK